MAELAFSVFIVLFFGMLFIRNAMVFNVRREFIDYFYDEDPLGRNNGYIFHDKVPSYDVMLWKFWVWPLSRFYPAYHNRKR